MGVSLDASQWSSWPENGGLIYVGSSSSKLWLYEGKPSSILMRIKGLEKVKRMRWRKGLATWSTNWGWQKKRYCTLIACVQVEARGAVSVEMLLHTLPPRHETRVFTAERGLRTTSPAASRKTRSQRNGAPRHKNVAMRDGSLRKSKPSKLKKVKHNSSSAVKCV